MVYTLANFHIIYEQHHQYFTKAKTIGNCPWQVLVKEMKEDHKFGVAVSPLFEIMKQEELVATFICALTKKHEAMAGLAFVDDTDLIVK